MFETFGLKSNLCAVVQPSHDNNRASTGDTMPDIFIV